MKKLLFLMMCIPLFALTGCSDDDDNDDSIVGKWECVADHMLVGNTWQKVYDYPAGEEIWEFSGSTLTVNYDADEPDGPLSYSFDGSTLTIGGESATVLISGNNMEIIFEDEDKTTFRKLN